MHIVGKNCCLNKTNYKSPLQKCEMNVEKQKKKKIVICTFNATEFSIYANMLCVQVVH